MRAWFLAWVAREELRDHGSLLCLQFRWYERNSNLKLVSFSAIRKKFPCIEAVEPQEACIKTCTSHHDAVTSLINNFKHLALSGDSTQAEKYLAESCEWDILRIACLSSLFCFRYVTCTLHCDVPAIASKCSFDTANLVIELTRKSFASMEKLALDTNTVSK